MEGINDSHLLRCYWQWLASRRKDHSFRECGLCFSGWFHTMSIGTALTGFSGLSKQDMKLRWRFLAWIGAVFEVDIRVDHHHILLYTWMEFSRERERDLKFSGKTDTYNKIQEISYGIQILRGKWMPDLIANSAKQTWQNLGNSVRV